MGMVKVRLGSGRVVTPWISYQGHNRMWTQDMSAHFVSYVGSENEAYRK